MNIVGIRIRQARLERMPQWSLEELSQALLQEAQLDLAASALSKIENGYRGVYDYEVQAFARTLGVSLEWLMYGDGNGLTSNPI